MPEEIIKAAIFTRDPAWRENKIFDVVANVHAFNHEVEVYARLKDLLKTKGIDLQTADRYTEAKETGLLIVVDPDLAFFKRVLRDRIDLKKAVLVVSEPPVANPRWSKLLPLYAPLFGAVLTWNPALAARGAKYVRCHFPVIFDRTAHDRFVRAENVNLCLLMHSNKVSPVRGELYSLRRRIIRSFEKRGDQLLDLFGYGWNDAASPHPFFTSLYKGTAADKMETFARYRFVLCIDNSIVPGYITYDPFFAMAAGSVPIYWPMPDSDAFVPPDTYIDFRPFKDDLDGLVAHLQTIVADGRYEAYRKSGSDFLCSNAFQPFTVERYCDDVYRAIQIALKR